MPSPEEEKDLAILHEQMQKLKNECYDHLQFLSRYKPEDIKHTGHKSIEAGMLWSFTDTEKKIQALIKAHLRKYPD